MKTPLVALLSPLLATVACNADRPSPQAAQPTQSSQPTRSPTPRDHAPPGWQPREGLALIGKPAPEWTKLQWVQGGPHELSDFRGKPVLIRFWLIGCPFCKATSTPLNDLHRKYAAQGLRVIGIHHPKNADARRKENVMAGAKSLGFKFPVALDNSWSTIKNYGVGSHFKRFTSISFLVGKSGRIVWVHDGGEFHHGGGSKHAACNRAYDDLLMKLAVELGDG